MAKHILFNNRDNSYSYEDYKRYCREFLDCEDIEIPAEDSEEYYSWQRFEIENDWENFMYEVEQYDKKVKESNGFVINGTLGLWDGKHDIQPVLVDTLKQAIEKCIAKCDYIEISYDPDEDVIEVVASHHDGTNVFTIEEVKYDIEAVGLGDLEKVKYTFMEMEQ